MEYHFILLFTIVLYFSTFAHSSNWPVGPQNYTERPKVESYCNGAVYHFCPTGFSDSHIPSFDDDDKIDLYVLKAPVWEFKFGKLLADFNIIHDAIGFKSHKTGHNYTTEWYELYQLFNCTFPHVVDGRSSPVWCNQGAVCVYPGITDKHWSENGTLKKVAEMSGKDFNKLADYIKDYNHTLPFYETWRVRNSSGDDYQQWFNPCDCATYVQRFFCQAYKLGAKFVDNYTPKYTFITLISDEPVKIGNSSEIFKSDKKKDVAHDIMQFYSYVQAHQPILHFLESLAGLIEYIAFKHEFYLYYNEEYWMLPIKSPFVKLTYEPITFDYCT